MRREVEIMNSIPRKELKEMTTNKEYKAYKWIEKSTGLVSPITQSLIQIQAEGTLGRQLTEKEMYRVWYSFLEDDDVRGLVVGTMEAAIEDALDNKDNQWDGIDEGFLEEKERKARG